MPAKLPDTVVRKQVLSVRCTLAERQEIEAAAGQTGLSDWLRNTVLWVIRSAAAPVNGVAKHEPDPWIENAAQAAAPAELPLTWADQWAFMERMEPSEAADRLAELTAVRKLPSGFTAWPKARKIAWLTKECPL
jgi:hypothetical protein